MEREVDDDDSSADWFAGVVHYQTSRRDSSLKFSHNESLLSDSRRDSLLKVSRNDCSLSDSRRDSLLKVFHNDFLLSDSRRDSLLKISHNDSLLSDSRMDSLLKVRYLACTFAGSFTQSGTVRHTCVWCVNPGVCVGFADGVARDLGAFSV